MNQRERILTLLSGGVPDHVPWFGDLAYYAGALERHGEVPKRWQRTKDYYDYHRKMRVGFYLQGYWAFDPVYDGEVEVRIEQEGRVQRTTVGTPLGTLIGETTYLPVSCSSAISRYMISTPKDLAVLRYWIEHTTYRPAPEEALRRRPWVEDLGIVLCYLPRTPFMELVVHFAGIGNIVALWSDARDEFEETLAVMARSSTEAAEAALQVPSDAFMIPENLSSEVVGRFYAKYVVPVEREWIKKIKQAGKYTYIHMDGTLRGLIRQVAETGFDVIEAVTPLPAGDVAIVDVRQVAGPRPILWGGIPGGYFTGLVSDQEFDRHVREVLDVMIQDRRMVLGVADQVPPDGLPKRIARVAELVEQYGAY